MAFAPKTQIYKNTQLGDISSSIFQDVSTRSKQNVKVGGEAGKVILGNSNTVVGYESGYLMNNANNTTCVGFRSGYSTNDSLNNTFVGCTAGENSISGSDLVFIGFASGSNALYASRSVGIGVNSLANCVTSDGVVAIGQSAGELSLDGSFNTMIGTESGQQNRSGNFNVMTGYRSGRESLLGNENVYVGAYSGYSNTHGHANTFIGYSAGKQITTGDYNIAIGSYALQNILNGSSNIAIGSFVGPSGSNISQNILLGQFACSNASSLSNTVVVGNCAGTNVSGDTSVIIGNNSASNVVYSDSNIFIGNGAGSYSSSNSLGIAIGNTNTDTNYNSVSIGNNIYAQNSNSVLIGSELTSDTAKSIILGNNISIQSVDTLQDPLSYIYVQTVMNDAERKFGISNIDYGDTLSTNTLNAIFTNAVSNVFDSRKTVVPLPISSYTYNLLSNTPNFAITNGAIIRAHDTTQEYIFDLKNYTTTDTTTRVSFNVNSTSNSVIANFSTPVTLNIYSSNQLNSLIDLNYIKPLPYAFISNLNYNSNVNANATSNLNLVFGLTSNTDLHTLQIPTVRVNQSQCVVSNLQNPNATAQSNYYVSTVPKYGTASITSNGHLTYTLNTENLLSTSDSLNITPVLVTDTTGNTTSNSSKVITVTNTQSNITFFQPNIIFNNSSYTFSQSNFVNFPTSYFSFLFDSPNMTLYDTKANKQYTQTDLQTIVTNDVLSYPDFLYSNYVNDIINTINTRVNNDLVSLNSNAVNVLSNVDIASNVFASNLFVSNNSDILNPSKLQSNIYLQQGNGNGSGSGSVQLQNYLVSWCNTYLDVYPLVQISNILPSLNVQSVDTTHSASATSIVSDINRLNYVYNQAPRLFVTQNDLQHITICNMDPNPQGNIKAIIHNTDSSQQLNLPYTTYSHPLWSDYPFSTNVTVSPNTKIPLAPSVCNVYISKYPQFGIVDTTNLIFHSFNPWKLTDTFSLVVSNSSSNTTRIDVTTSNLVNTVNDIPFMSYPDTVNVSTNYNPTRTSQVTQNVYNVINVNGVEFSCNLVSNYDPVVGYNIINCNISYQSNVTVNNSNGSGSNFAVLQLQYILFNNDILNLQTSNTSQRYIGSNYTSNCDSNFIYTQTTIESQSNYRPVGSNIYLYDNTKVTSNFSNYDYILNCNTYIYNTQSNFSNTTVISQSPLIQTNPNGPLTMYYFNDQLITSNVTKLYFPLTKQYIYNNSDSNYIYNVSNVNVNVNVVVKDIGITNSFNQTQLLQNEVYTISNTSSHILTSTLQTNYNMTVDPITHINSSLTSLFAQDISSLPTNYRPVQVRIASIRNGIFAYTNTNTIQSITQFPIASLSNISYMSTASSDTISYFYTDSSDVNSIIFVKNITINIPPNPFGQDINTGVGITQLSNVSINTSYSSNYVLIQSSPGLSLYHGSGSGSKINVGDTFNNSAVIRLSSTGVSQYSIVYSANGTTFTHPVRTYSYYAYQTSNTAGNIINQYYGNGPWVTRTNGTLWDNIFTMQSNTNSTVNIRVVNQPTNGLIVNGLNSEMVQMAPLSSLSNIRYVTYNQDQLQNDTISITFVCDNQESPLYTIPYKNYVCRFNNRSVNTFRDTIVYAPAQSLGMIQDGIIVSPLAQSVNANSNANANFVWYIENNYFTESIITYYASPPTNVNIGAVNISCDQADNFNLASNSSFVNIASDNKIIFYVSTVPTNGIIYNTSKQTTVTTFTSFELNAGVILYQHNGSETTTDTFTVNLAYNLYNYNTTPITVNVSVQQLPKLISNSVKYSFGSNVLIFDNLEITPSNWYIHTLSNNTIFNSTTPIFTSNIKDNVIINNTSNHINGLASNPQYSNLFVYPIEGYINTYVYSNVIESIPKTHDNIIYYFSDIDTLQGKDVSVSVRIKNTCEFADLNGYSFKVQLGDYTLVLNDTNTPLQQNTWYLLTLHNSTTGLNVNVSTLNGTVVYSSNFATVNNIYKIALIGDIVYSVSEIQVNSNTYNLTNYNNYIQLQGLNINANVYSTNSTNSSLNTHNIVAGKDVNINGINNICFGNQFNTAGQNSIIIGNSIGGTSNGINEIYQSIVIGNDSFTNSAIRDIIAIGNNILDDLSTIDPNSRDLFLSQKPIVIGNDVTCNCIDFTVNIANTFLKTSKGGDQVYLGKSQEIVAIGYTSNNYFNSTNAPNTDLTVARSISAGAVNSVLTFIGLSDNSIPIGTVVSSLGNIDTATGYLNVNISTVVQDPSVAGICILSTETFNSKYLIQIGYSGYIKVNTNTHQPNNMTLGTSVISNGDGTVCGTVNQINVIGKTVSNVIDNYVYCIIRV